MPSPFPAPVAYTVWCTVDHTTLGVHTHRVGSRDDLNQISTLIAADRHEFKDSGHPRTYHVFRAEWTPVEM